MAERSGQYLFGIDLDGTLLSPAGEVTPRTKAAVHAILNAGHRVAFATGRNYIEARKIFEKVEHRDLAVLVSGAMVVDTRNGQTVRRSNMNPQLAAELCGAIERLGHAAVAFQDRHFTGIDYMVSLDRFIHEALSSWLTLSEQRMEHRHDLANHDHAHTLRVSTVLDLKSAEEIKEVVTREFNQRAYVHGIIVANEGVEIVEMFDPYVNKWLGLQQIASHYAIDFERIITFGDDHNDLPMIRNATLGVAMGNARPDVKSAAKRVIRSNAEEGLAEFLERWLANPEEETAGNDNRDGVSQAGVETPA